MNVSISRSDCISNQSDALTSLIPATCKTVPHIKLVMALLTISPVRDSKFSLLHFHGNNRLKALANEDTSWATICPQPCVLVYQGLNFGNNSTSAMAFFLFS